VVGRLLPASSRWAEGCRGHRSRAPRPIPRSAPARPRGIGRGLAVDDEAARPDVPASRDRQLPLERGGRGPGARRAAQSLIPGVGASREGPADWSLTLRTTTGAVGGEPEPLPRGSGAVAPPRTAALHKTPR